MTPETLALAARIRPVTKWPIGTRIYRPVQRVTIVQDTALDGEGSTVPVGAPRRVVEEGTESYVVTSLDASGGLSATGDGRGLRAAVMPAHFGVPDLDDSKTVEVLATEAGLNPKKATLEQIAVTLETAAKEV